jgi:hypothetical protein
MKEGQSKIWRVDPLNNKNMSRRHSHLNLGDLLKCGVLVEYFKIGLPRVGFFCLFVCLFSPDIFISSLLEPLLKSFQRMGSKMKE